MRARDDAVQHDDFWKLRQTRGAPARDEELRAADPRRDRDREGAGALRLRGHARTSAPEFEQVPIQGAYDLRVDRGVRGRAGRGHPGAEPGAAPPGDARRPHVRRSGCRRGPGEAWPSASAAAAGEAGHASARTWCGAGRPSASIARANGVAARDVAEANGLAPQKRLRLGHRADHPDPGRGRASPRRRPRARRDAAEARAACATGSSPATRSPRSPPSTARRSASCRPGTGCAARDRRRHRPDDLHGSQPH